MTWQPSPSADMERVALLEALAKVTGLVQVLERVQEPGLDETPRTGGDGRFSVAMTSVETAHALGMLTRELLRTLHAWGADNAGIAQSVLAAQQLIQHCDDLALALQTVAPWVKREQTGRRGEPAGEGQGDGDAPR